MSIIFVIKLLFSLSFILMLLIKTTAISQPRGFGICYDRGNYTRNSTYQRNLDNTFSTLPTTDNGLGFFKFSGGQGSESVHSYAVCRGDIHRDLCHRCLNESIVTIKETCPYQKGAISFYDECWLNYYNDYSDNLIYMTSFENRTSEQHFIGVLKSLLEELVINAAAGGMLQKFATGNTTYSDSITIYGLMQCVPDWSKEECTYCLQNLINLLYFRFPDILGTTGKISDSGCRLGYDTFPFFNVSTLRRISSAAIPVSSPPQGKSSNKALISIVLVIVTVCVIIIVFICIFLRTRRKKKQVLPTDDNNAPPLSLSFGSSPRSPTSQAPPPDTVDRTLESLSYDFNSVKAATGNFSEDSKLGRGGFGDVYKGELDGREIAVKRLEVNSQQGVREFSNEVLLLAKLQHRNLVRLHGFSVEGTERLLIYEFLSNGSLDKILFDSSKRASLNWEMRYHIIIGVAKGLLYIHEDSRLKIIHCDMKAGNILLDAEMNAKIADFGTAKLFKHGESEGDTERVMGTYGYMAPEYVLFGEYSGKSDVFSYGVLVLEVIAGRKNLCFHNEDRYENLTSLAWESWMKGTMIEIIDPLLRTGSCSLDDAIRSIHIGLLCVQEKAADRPTMESVTAMLNNSSSALPVPSQPAFFLPSNPTEPPNLFIHSNSSTSTIVTITDLNDVS